MSGLAPLLKRGDLAGARRLAGTFAARFPQSQLKAEIRLIEARAAAQEGKHDEAVEILARVDILSAEFHRLAGKTLVDQGALCATIVTSLTMDRALEMLVRAITDGSQPPEHTFVEAYSYPSVEQLARKWRAS